MGTLPCGLCKLVTFLVAFVANCKLQFLQTAPEASALVALKIVYFFLGGRYVSIYLSRCVDWFGASDTYAASAITALFSTSLHGG